MSLSKYWHQKNGFDTLDSKLENNCNMLDEIQPLGAPCFKEAYAQGMGQILQFHWDYTKKMLD